MSFLDPAEIAQLCLASGFQSRQAADAPNPAPACPPCPPCAGSVVYPPAERFYAQGIILLVGCIVLGYCAAHLQQWLSASVSHSKET